MTWRFGVGAEKPEKKGPEQCEMTWRIGAGVEKPQKKGSEQG